MATSSHHLIGQLPAAVTETAAADAFAGLALGSGLTGVAFAAAAVMKGSEVSLAATIFASASPASDHPHAPAQQEPNIS